MNMIDIYAGISRWHDIRVEYLEDKDVFRLWQGNPGECSLTNDRDQVCFERNQIPEMMRVLQYCAQYKYTEDDSAPEYPATAQCIEPPKLTKERSRIFHNARTLWDRLRGVPAEAVPPEYSVDIYSRTPLIICEKYEVVRTDTHRLYGVIPCSVDRGVYHCVIDRFESNEDPRLR